MDKIEFAIFQSRLDSITEEMGIGMARSAQSPIFAASHDFSCFVTEANGYVASDAEGLPLHTGSGGFAVRRCKEYWGDDLGPGDLYLLNDPYFAGGNHLPDWAMIMPVFHQDQLLGFSCARAHMIDIGGGYPGTYNSAAKEIFEEGVRLPPLRLYERGRRREDIWDLLLLNTRMPDTVAGDLGAMMGACRIGVRRLEALASELGLATLLKALDGILDYGETVMRQGIAAIPDGVYDAVELMNNDCFERVDVPIKVAVAIEGSDITVDLTGSSPPIQGFKNSPYTNTYAAVCLGVRTVVNPFAPMNEGAYRMIKVVAPENTLVNARAPSACTMCTVFPATEIIHAIWRALARVIPDQVSAGWGKPTYPLSSGADREGDTYVMYHWGGMGGAGATNERDGMDQVGILVALANLRVPSLELFEQLYPVHFLRHEFRMDGGGPGRYRGGTGVHYAVRVEQASRWSFRCEGLFTPSGFGVAGGADGREGVLRMTDLETGEPIDTPQYGVRDLPPVLFELDSPGGGGWGDPRAREPEAVRLDVLGGVVSVESARADYGVALTGPELAVDVEETTRLRGSGEQAAAAARGDGQSLCRAMGDSPGGE